MSGTSSRQNPNEWDFDIVGQGQSKHMKGYHLLKYIRVGMSSKGFDDYDYYSWVSCAPSTTCKSNFQVPEMCHKWTIQCPPTRQVAYPIQPNFPFTSDSSMIEHTVQTCQDRGCTWVGIWPPFGMGLLTKVLFVWYWYIKQIFLKQILKKDSTLPIVPVLKIIWLKADSVFQIKLDTMQIVVK